MIVVISVGGYPIYVCGMCDLPAFCEESKIFKNVILCVSPNPGTSVRSTTNAYRKCSDEGYEPYIIVDGPHHAVLGLLDGNLQALGLAIACHRGRSMAKSAVWIHPDCWFADSVVSSIHL